MGDDEYIASIGLTGATYAPQGYSFCQGQVLSIAQNDALFSLIGDIYGGNGTSSFGLPDLRASVPVGTGARPGSTFALDEEGVVTSSLTRLSWPGGFPNLAETGEATTLPDVAGVTGVALNWAMCLYGLYPPRP